jgi:hypothetical protein
LRRDPNDPAVVNSSTLEIRGLTGARAELQTVIRWASDPQWIASLDADGLDYPIRDIRARTLRGRENLIYVEFVSHSAAEFYFEDLVVLVDSITSNGTVSWTSTRPGDRVFRRPFARFPDSDDSDEPEPGWSRVRRSQHRPHVRFSRGFEARRTEWIDYSDPNIASRLIDTLDDIRLIFERLRDADQSERLFSNAPVVAMSRILLLPDTDLFPTWYDPAARFTVNRCSRPR